MAMLKPVTGPLCTSAAALCLCMTAPAAFADVTPAQIWGDWQSYFATSGFEITGQEALSDGGLTVTDITMLVEIPEEDVTLTINMGEITLTDTGDGAVAVSWPEVMPIIVDVDGADDEDVQIRLEYLTSGLDMSASGDPDDIAYAYTADSVALELRDLMVGGTAMDLGTLRLAMQNVEGASRTLLSDLRQSEQTLAAGPVTYDVDMPDPEGGEGRLVLTGSTATVALDSTAATPLDVDFSNMAAAIAQGFKTDVSIAYVDGATTFTFAEEGQTIEGSSSSDKTDLAVSFGQDGISYALGTDGLNIAMAGADIPFPLEFAMSKMGVDVSLPVMASEQPQDFELGLLLADFTMSDMIWAMFDPQGQLPRDPATVELDMAGVARLFIDFLDPEAMESLEGGEVLPGEVDALDLNSLTLRAAGAELTGQGSFVFDNSDMQTFGGIPAPDGSVDLRLQGANDLLDTLISMGYLPEDQAMGVRMMMGMFAVPGDGEDVLNSTIEVRPDGQVLANGQRLR